MADDPKSIFRMLSFAQLCAEGERIAAERLSRRNWGRWRLDTATLELVFEERPGCGKYFVDLERMRTSAAMLDWIFQLHKKGWATVQDIGELIRALNDIFDPQAMLCSGACGSGGATGSKIDSTAYLRSRYSDAQGTP